MQISNLAFISAIEVFVVLLFACVLLLIYTRNLKSLLTALQGKLAQLIKELKKSKAAYRDIKQKLQSETSPNNAYKKQINDQLLLTRQYHLTLGATQDIALDLNVKAPLDRQMAAFRHAVLIAEKEALYASETQTPNWIILQSKLEQLVQFYQSKKTDPTDENSQDTDKEALQDTINTQKKRIENLEKFKKLFFDMEKQWNEAKQQAQNYHQQLSGMAAHVEDKESFNNILDQYHTVYDRVSDMIEHTAASDGPRINTLEITKMDPRSQSEINKLRNVAADQHRIISELERKLQEAKSIEEKDAVMNDLSEQLQRQTRFVQESETCIKLLEDELNRAMQQISDIEAPPVESDDTKNQNKNLKNMVEQFSLESKEMLQSIERLEQENKQLLGQLDINSQQATHSDNITAGNTTESAPDNGKLKKAQKQVFIEKEILKDDSLL